MPSSACFNQSGHKIKRVGQASVQRVLMEPVAILGDKGAPQDYAMVQCPDADVYLSRDGEGQRSCEFVLQYWEGDESQTEVFPFQQREKAIERFLKLIKRENSK